MTKYCTPSISHSPGPPGPPHTPTVTDIGDTWVELTWQPPTDVGRPELSYYSILLTETNSKLVEAWSTNGLVTNFMINGVLPSRVYDIEVASVTELTGSTHVSNYSNGVTVTTRPPLGMCA